LGLSALIRWRFLEARSATISTFAGGSRIGLRKLTGKYSLSVILKRMVIRDELIQWFEDRRRVRSP
jgi:hypothetical protein